MVFLGAVCVLKVVKFRYRAVDLSGHTIKTSSLNVFLLLVLGLGFVFASCVLLTYSTTITLR